MSKTECSYCGGEINSCPCDRTQHIYNPKDGKCMLCGYEFVVNGTGPQGKWYTPLIKAFWFNRWVNPISDQHDIDYQEGFSEAHKRHADNRMLEATIKKIDRTWYLRPKFMWHKRAEINHLAVVKGGEDSFNWSGCVCSMHK